MDPQVVVRGLFCAPDKSGREGQICTGGVIHSALSTWLLITHHMHLCLHYHLAPLSPWASASALLTFSLMFSFSSRCCSATRASPPPSLKTIPLSCMQPAFLFPAIDGARACLRLTLLLLSVALSARRRRVGLECCAP